MNKLLSEPIKWTLIFIGLFFMSACCLEPNEIRSAIHEDSFDWFSLYENGDTRLFQKTLQEEINDSSVFFILDTLDVYSDYEFFDNKNCHPECRPTCQEIEGSDLWINLLGVEEDITFSIRSELIKRGYKLTLDNSGELVDSLKIYRLEQDTYRERWVRLEIGLQDELTYIKKDTIQHNFLIYDDCFEISYQNTESYCTYRFNFTYCKNEGVLRSEEVNKNVGQIDSNQVMIRFKKLSE